MIANNKAVNTKHEYEKNKKLNIPKSYDINMEYSKNNDVKNGCWVLITRLIPVENYLKPVLYGIYWGIPNEDEFGRQTCKIRTAEDIVLLNHEYVIISEEKLEKYRKLGYELNNVINPSMQSKPLNLELIENGKSLVEEEREVIWALQLDGLSEEQACEEYFLSKHTDASNYTICFLPGENVKFDLYSTFADVKDL